MFGDVPQIFVPGGTGGGGGSPTGAAGGDLAGTYPSPTLALDTSAALNAFATSRAIALALVLGL